MASSEGVTVLPKTAEVVATEPSKVLGDKEAGCACAKVWVNKMDGGRQTMRICLEKGFDWRKSVKPTLPNTPDWCPATHFGYLEAGCMEIQMEDGSSKTIKAGETYYVPPGHIPVLHEDSVMVEFSQDTTYSNKDYLEKK